MLSPIVEEVLLSPVVATPALVLLLGAAAGGVVEIDVDCPAVLVLGETTPLPMAWPTVQSLQPPFCLLCSQMPAPLHSAQ